MEEIKKDTKSTYAEMKDSINELSNYKNQVLVLKSYPETKFRSLLSEK